MISKKRENHAPSVKRWGEDRAFKKRELATMVTAKIGFQLHTQKRNVRLLLCLLLLLITPSCERDKPATMSTKGPSTQVKQEQARVGTNAKSKLLTFSFPQVPLEQEERIIGFEITITSGSVRSINNIPGGWSVRLDNELSWKPVLSGKIHHGVEALTESRELHSLAVIDTDPSGEAVPPFHVEAKLFTTVNFRSTITRSFPMSDLLLNPGG